MNCTISCTSHGFKLFDDYSSLVSETRHKAFHGKGIKNQRLKMFQRLPIALVQVKAGNISDNLFNETRDIVYYLRYSKEIPKNVYNDIIKSKQI